MLSEVSSAFVRRSFRGAGTGDGLAVSQRLIYEEAAATLGCHFSNVAKLIRNGGLTSTGKRGASLNRVQVAALTERRAAERAARTARSQRKYRRLDHCADADHEWLSLTYQNGAPVKPQYVTRLFDKLRVKAGLPDMTFHGLRHQQATLQLAAGTPLAVVSKRLGHSASVTADIYSHLLRSTEREAANSAASLVPPRKTSAHAVHRQRDKNDAEAAPALNGNGL